MSARFCSQNLFWLVPAWLTTVCHPDHGVEPHPGGDGEVAGRVEDGRGVGVAGGAVQGEGVAGEAGVERGPAVQGERVGMARRVGGHVAGAFVKRPLADRRE